jgi:hypothetical protein
MAEQENEMGVGFGWQLMLPAITRKPDKGVPRYADDRESDVFILTSLSAPQMSQVSWR